MLRPITHEELRPAELPHDCIMQHQIGPDRVLLVSYDMRGVEFEEFRTTPQGASANVTASMLARVRKHDANRPRLMP